MTKRNKKETYGDLYISRDGIEKAAWFICQGIPPFNIGQLMDRAKTARKLRAQAGQYVATLGGKPVEMRVCRQRDTWAPGLARHNLMKPCSHCNGAGVVFVPKDRLYRYDGIQIA